MEFKVQSILILKQEDISVSNKYLINNSPIGRLILSKLRNYPPAIPTSHFGENWTVLLKGLSVKSRAQMNSFCK